MRRPRRQQTAGCHVYLPEEGEMGPTRRGGGSRQLATVASVAELPPLGLSQNAPAKPSKSFHPILFKIICDWIGLFIVDLCPAPVVRYIGGFLVSEGSY